MKQYQGILFDFNGTLFFDTPYHFQAWDKLRSQFHLPPLVQSEFLSSYAGVPNVEIIQNMFPEFTHEQCIALSLKKEEYYRQIVQQTSQAKLAPGVISFFKYLNEKQIPFTIVSASIKENIDFFVSFFQLDQYLDPKTIIYDNNHYTDKQQMFLDGKKMLDIQDPILIFEDSTSGIQCGIQIGADVIAVQNTSFHHPNIIKRIQDFQDPFLYE